jgi:biopolymer transport protein ExbD
MGDIAFLLIIFFILASIPKGEVSLTHPETDDLSEIERTGISVVMDEDGQCFFQNNPEPVPVEALTGLIKGHFASPDQNENRRVVVEIDRNLPYEVFKDVYSAVSEAGGIVVARGIIKGNP